MKRHILLVPVRTDLRALSWTLARVLVLAVLLLHGTYAYGDDAATASHATTGQVPESPAARHVADESSGEHHHSEAHVPRSSGREHHQDAPAPRPVADTGLVPTVHPIMVHLVIGLLAGAILFELAWALTGVRSLRDAARWNLVAAAPAAAAAVLTGYLEARRQHGHGAFADEIHALLWYHEYIGYTLVTTVAVLALWRFMRPTTGTFVVRLTLALVAAALMVQGYLGGEMVYRYGSGVQAPLAGAPVVRPEGGHAHGPAAH